MAGGCRVIYRCLATRMQETNWTCDWTVEGEKGLLTVENDRLWFNGEQVPVAWEDGADIGDLNLGALNKIVFQQFLDYLNGGPEPGFSGHNNLNSLEIAFGAIKAYETGQKYVMGS